MINAIGLKGDAYINCLVHITIILLCVVVVETKRRKYTKYRFNFNAIDRFIIIYIILYRNYYATQLRRRHNDPWSVVHNVV